MRPDRRDDKLPFDLPPEIGLAAREPIVRREGRPEGQRESRPDRRVTWVMVGALTLVIGALGLGLIWWGMTSRQTAATLDDVPLVKAGGTPVKERPTDPGGLSVADRDKLVYRRVGDDGTPPPAERLLPPPEAPGPAPAAPAAEPASAAAPSPAEAAPETDAGTGAGTGAGTDADEIPTEPSGALASPEAQATASAELSALIDRAIQPAATATHQIQLASVRTEAEALSEWKRLSGRHADLLGTLKLDVSRVELGDRGVWFRVRGGPLAGEAAATALCQSLKARNVGCLVIGPSG